MAYKTEELFNTAIEQIKKHKLFFIEDIIAFLPCRKSTFYEHFPNNSDYYKRMFEELETNRVELKVSMRKKWYASEAPALQMALMKLIANPEELRKLSMNTQAHEGSVKVTPLLLNDPLINESDDGTTED